MALIQEFEKTGNYLFKKRSYLPLVLFALAGIAIFLDSEEIYSYKNIYFSFICYAVSLFGLYIRIMTISYLPKGTFGRNVANQVADSLNTKGIYSIVRHPLYLGNFFMWLGLIIYVGLPWFMIFCVLSFWIYYERIMFAEESFLRGKFGNVYEDWASRTPAFIPRFSMWTSADLEFSFKKFLKREFYGLFAASVSFALVNFIKNVSYIKEYNLDFHWIVVVAATFLIFVVLRTIKKKTRIFEGY